MKRAGHPWEYQAVYIRLDRAENIGELLTRQAADGWEPINFNWTATGMQAVLRRPFKHPKPDVEAEKT